MELVGNADFGLGRRGVEVGRLRLLGFFHRVALLDSLGEERRLRLDQLGLLGVIGADLDGKARVGRLLLGRVVPPLPRRPYRLAGALVGDQLGVFVRLRKIFA